MDLLRFDPILLEIHGIFPLGIFLSQREKISRIDGTKKGKFVAAFDKCPDNDRLRSCLWPEVLEGTVVLRMFDTQLYIDLRDSCAEIP